jgi:two-component system OmpR family response regulator
MGCSFLFGKKITGTYRHSNIGLRRGQISPGKILAIYVTDGSFYTNWRMDTKILIVEDDRNLQKTLAYNLEREKYRVFTAGDGVKGLEIARREKPDLIILDLMLPEMSGLEVCRILRQETIVPILILTARAEETDKVVGLEIGADDYMTKPFSMKELIARVHAMLRRTLMVAPDISGGVIKIGSLSIDLSRHIVMVNDKVLELTPKEYDLLAFLAINRGIVFSREQLLEKVWGYEYAGDTRTVDVHVSWLRQKIEEDPHMPQLLLTVRGTGYRLEG